MAANQTVRDATMRSLNDNGNQSGSDDKIGSTNVGPSTDPVLNQYVTLPRRGSALPWKILSLILAIVLVSVFWSNRSCVSPVISGDSRMSESISVGLKLSPANLDIRNQSGTALDQVLVGNVYEGLVARDQQNRVVPALAKSWQISEDGKTYTFELNTNITFSNGHQLAAQDVVWSINELMTHHYRDSNQLRNFQKVQAIGSDRVELTLSAPYAHTLWVLTGRPGLVFDRNAEYNPKTQAVGSGPYVVESFVPNDGIVLKANRHYWGQHQAKTKTVYLRYFSDDNAAVNALRSKDIQVLAPITANLSAPFIDDSKNYNVDKGVGSDKFVLAFNNKGSKTSDLRVRQAIRYAINHQELISSRGGNDRALGGPIPSVDPGYRDLTHVYPYDRTKAEQLMAQAGYTRDKPVTLRLTYANTYGTELGDQLRSQLKPVGIELQVNLVEFSTWMQDVYVNHDYDLSIVDHAESHDFSQWTDSHYYFGYDNPEVQKLYDKAMAARNVDDTDSYLAEAARKVSQDAPADWLFSYSILTASLKGVQGFPLNLNQTLMGLWQMSYAPNYQKVSSSAVSKRPENQFLRYEPPITVGRRLTTSMD